MPYFGLLSWHQWQRGLNCPMTLGSTWNLNIFMDLETGRKPNWQTETNNLVRNLPIVVTSWLNRRKWMQMMQWEHLGGTSLILAWWWVFKNCSSVTNSCSSVGFRCCTCVNPGHPGLTEASKTCSSKPSKRRRAFSRSRVRGSECPGTAPGTVFASPKNLICLILFDIVRLISSSYVRYVNPSRPRPRLTCFSWQMQMAECGGQSTSTDSWWLRQQAVCCGFEEQRGDFEKFRAPVREGEVTRAEIY